MEGKGTRNGEIEDAEEIQVESRSRQKAAVTGWRAG